MYKISSQFPNFTGKTIEELSRFVNELVFKVKNELVALQRESGGTNTFVTNIGGSSGGGSTTTANTRTFNETITTVTSGGSNITVTLSTPFTRTDYVVLCELKDSSGNILLCTALPSTQTVNSFQVFCMDNGTLKGIAIQP